MKNRFFVLFVIAIVVLSLAGCGKDKDAKIFDAPTIPDSQAVSDDQSSSDIFSESDIMSESDIFDIEELDHAYSIQIRDLDEALLTVTYNDGTDAESVDAYTWFGSEGMTVGQMMNEWSVESVVPSCEGYDFLGWMAYETVTTTDENGFDEYTETVLFDGKILSTDEMMAIELPDSDVCFYTVWDLVCSECGEHKLCSAYYIDDDCFFVCDDCYPAFEENI